MFWIPMMIGAAGGALMNKKDPLKGALLGAGLGAVGGAGLGAMGGVMGSGAASAVGASGSTGGGLLASGAASVIPEGMTAAQMGAMQAEAAATGIDVGTLMGSQGIAAPMTASGSAGGFTNGALFNSGTSAPIFEKGVQATPEAIKAIQEGKTFGGLLNSAGNAAKTASTVKEMMPEEPSIPPPQVMPPNANPTLASLYNGMQEQWMQEAQLNEMKRQKRKQLIGRMG